MFGQTDFYDKEIFNFLRTVTIKFEPFAYQMGEPYMSEHGLSDPDGDWNPYYQNLVGNYSEADQVMKVYSVEDGSEVTFDRNLILTHPKTASLYKVGTVEYTNLEDKYPSNRGLIKSIVYPVADIKTAIEAPNLSLLAYDASYLEINERESIITRLKEFLEECRTRWWVPEYQYEDLYAVSFWTMIHQLLPIVLLVQRFENIRTPSVHSFHIWEYLKSKGLDDYRDILTTKQSLWLYRNIDHINKHKGTESNLRKLSENILSDIAVSLQYKDMYQDNEIAWTNIENRPKFMTFNLLSNKQTKEEDFENLNMRIVEQGLDVKKPYDKVVEIEKELGKHNYNILPTKYLELKKDTLDTSYAKALANFFLDTLMYKTATGKLVYTVHVRDPYTGGLIKLSVHDAILLYYYSLHASFSENASDEIVYIPNRYVCRYAYKNEKPDIQKLKDKRVTIGKWSKTLQELINLKGLINSHSWRDRITTDVNDFARDLAKDYTAYIWTDRWINGSANFVYHLGMKQYECLTSVKDVLKLELTSEITFKGWMNSVPQVQEAIENIESDPTKKDLYASLSLNCWDALFPVTSEMSNLLSSPRQMEMIYTATKELFVKLCSYGVTYLDTDRHENQYCKVPDPDFIFHIGGEISFDGPSGSNIFNVVLDPIKHRALENSKVSLPKNSFNCDLSTSRGENKWTYNENIDVGPSIRQTRTDSISKAIVAGVKPRPDQIHYVLNFTCDVGF